MSRTETVQLLLDAPGQTPTDLPRSPWRSWVLTDRGPVLPPVAAVSIRLSPVASRAERALVAAVVADDPVALTHAVDSAGATQNAARVLFALRHADLNPAEASSVLFRVVGSSGANDKLLQRHWGNLYLHVTLAPGVPALVTLGRTGLGLLLADILVSSGRPAEALGVLDSLVPTSPVLLAQTATLLAHGDHRRVLEVTAHATNADDVGALVLVARSVAARTLGDLGVALDAATAAMARPDRGLGVLCAALEERSHVYSVNGDRAAAQADLAAIAAVAEGALRIEVPVVAPLRRPGTEAPVQYSMDRARDRMRRRIAVGDRPGTFGGRHHSTYRDDIAAMFSMGQIKAVEELLLGLLDVVEDEVDELGMPLDETFFLTLADLYHESGRSEDLRALRERYAAAEQRARQHAAAAASAGAGEGSTAPPSVALDGPPADDGAAGPSMLDAATARRTDTSVDTAVDPTVEPTAEPTFAPTVDPMVAAEASTAPAEPVAAHAPVRLTLVEAAPEDDDERDEHEPDGGDHGPDDDHDDDTEPEASIASVERELTAVERMVRGPRLRAL